MKEDFEINGRVYSIEMSLPEKNGVEVLLNGERYSLESIRHIGGNRVLVIKDSKTYEVALRGDGDGTIELNLPGSSILASRCDDKNVRKFLAGDSASFGNKVVSSIMPGKIVKVFTRVGSIVKKGDPLLIIEAMKMENELKSPSNGKVKKINVKEGISIEANVPLVIIE